MRLELPVCLGIVIESIVHIFTRPGLLLLWAQYVQKCIA